MSLPTTTTWTPSTVIAFFAVISQKPRPAIWHVVEWIKHWVILQQGHYFGAKSKFPGRNLGKGRLCSAFSKQWNQQMEGHGLEWQNSQLKRTRKGLTLQGSGAGQRPRGRPQITDWQNHYSVTQGLQGLVLSQMSLILLSLRFPGPWQKSQLPLDDD